MEKPRAGSESFLHRAFLRAAEIWDVRIGVYNIRSMAGNAIMDGETRYLTKKKPCARWSVGVQFPKNPPCGASIYSVCDFSRNVNAPKVKCSCCFQGVAAGARLSWGLRGSGKAVCFMQRRGKRDVPAVSRAWRRGRAFLGGCEERKAACSMQRRGKRDVPAVSRARRRIERLRGVQFCRRALEIRSEVSAPARLVPRRWVEKRGGLRLLGFGSGGRGDGRRLFSTLKESGYGGLCPHPLRKLSFLRTFLLLPRFWWRRY